MRTRQIRQWFVMAMVWGCLALSSQMAAAQGAPGILKKGDRVAIVGDSITEQKIYSRYLETYLLACLPQLELRVTQLGWSGETAPGFLSRLENDLIPWRPCVVTLCYGMNDGGYQPFDAEIGKRYQSSMEKIVERLKAVGATVVVGSPGIVDPHYFPPEFLVKFGKNVDGKTYNENLARLRDIARDIAGREGFPFANVYDPMEQVMSRLKADLGPSAIVTGNDGVHPWDNGHLVMAYAFLKGIGVDGAIGAVELDMKAGTASASEGHQVVSAAPGWVELESTRYPFCFAKNNSVDQKTSWSARGVLPYIPFNQELNRLTLKVRGLKAERAELKWGGDKKAFSRKQLEQGINLAAEFLDNPFSEPFARVDRAVAEKEAFETFAIKQIVTQFRSLPQGMEKHAQVRQALEQTRSALAAADDSLHAAARAAVKPVRHTISIKELP